MRYLFPFALATALLTAQEGPFDGTPSFEADDSISWAGEGTSSTDLVKDFCQFNADFERIFFSHFRDEIFREDKIAYSEGNVLMSYTRFLCPGTAALNVGLGYNHTHLSWANNPFFQQNNYDCLTFNLNGFTSFCEKTFVLKGGASANVDTREWDGDYTYYMLTGWGRYAWRTYAMGEVGFNLGATGRAGLGEGFITPIVGVDFHLCSDIRVNLIFPIDMAIIYSLDECWSLSLTGRIWNTKRRWGVDEPVPRGYWEYKNEGIDLGLNFEWDPIAAFNIHIGTTLGRGRIRISNAQDTRIGEFRFDAAPYLGGELWFRF